MRRIDTPRGWVLAAGCVVAAISLLYACGGGGSDSTAYASPGVTAVGPSSAASAPTGPPKATVLNNLLSAPWGLAFLPDGRMLVTQKAGTMVIVDADGATVSSSIGGLPPVVNNGQGGLLDVAIDPNFATEPWVYWSYSEPGPAGTASTAVARGRLVGNALQNISVIFSQTPKIVGTDHFGSRLAFRPDGTLFITLGEREQDNPSAPDVLFAQNLAIDFGKVVRINRDGSIPADNPDLGPLARPEIWSYGHRNPQGVAIRPGTDELWEVEHGPQGGDELNRVTAGGNYGWPIKSYGCPYGSPLGDLCRVGGGVHAPGFIEPVSTWLPLSIAPSSLTFYTGDKFPEWKGNAFITALAGQALWRIALNGNSEAAREKLFGDLGERLRCVRQGPDGWLYLLTDSGKLIRIDR